VKDVKWKEVATPATENLFRVCESGIELLETSKVKIIQQLQSYFFVAKCGRMDALLAVSFLTMRV
jgi:hypothetical protein